MGNQEKGSEGEQALVSKRKEKNLKKVILKKTRMTEKK